MELKWAKTVEHMSVSYYFMEVIFGQVSVFHRYLLVKTSWCPEDIFQPGDQSIQGKMCGQSVRWYPGICGAINRMVGEDLEKS